jgi:hypothetical protein
VPGKALVRYQFLEMFLRIALYKFLECKFEGFGVIVDYRENM